MTVHDWLDGLRHLTWSGRSSALWYPVRRLVVRPAPTENRCFMGSPVGPHVWCPRRAADGEMWCTRHMPDAPTERTTST